MSEKICGVYQILNTVNGDCYIGSSVNIKVRWSQHKTSLTKSKNGSLKLQHAWDKYGKNSFKFNILEIVTEYKGELYKREQYYIDVFDSVDNGYNICIAAGSRAGTNCSEETKAKMSIAHKGEKNPNYGKPPSNETRQKISESNTGKKASPETREKLRDVNSGQGNPMYGRCGEENPLYGIPRSEETKAKMSAALKGKFIGDLNPNYGKPRSEETKAKLQAANLGENNPRWGKTHSEETKAKMSASAKKRWADKKALKTAS